MAGAAIEYSYIYAHKKKKKTLQEDKKKEQSELHDCTMFDIPTTYVALSEPVGCSKGSLT